VRTAWTLFEDKQVVDSVIKYGNKWSKIAKELGGKRS
jgi:heterodisulfide reductase subunit C